MTCHPTHGRILLEAVPILLNEYDDLRVAIHSSSSESVYVLVQLRATAAGYECSTTWLV